MVANKPISNHRSINAFFVSRGAELEAFETTAILDKKMRTMPLSNARFPLVLQPSFAKIRFVENPGIQECFFFESPRGLR